MAGHAKNLSKRRHVDEPKDRSPSGTSTVDESASTHKKVRWDKDVSSQNEETADISEDEESPESIDKLCLAISCQYGRVGCAYYDSQLCKMFIFEDSQENTHYDLTAMILDQVEPDIMLTTSKAEDGFIESLQSHADSSGSTFQLRPHKDFLHDKARNRLLSLPLLSELATFEMDTRATSDPSSDSTPQNAYDFMKRRKEINGDPIGQRWNASVRMGNYALLENSPLCLGSIGALLEHVSRMRAVAELDDDGIESLIIRAIEYLPLQQVMQINADALRSLQIFEEENHASVNSDKTKEGLSLFGILNNTKTRSGRLLMREWLLRPSLSIPVITARYDAVACFLRPDNLALVNAMHNHLNGIKNVPKILNLLKAGKAKLADWQGVVKFAFHSVMIKDSLPELTHAGNIGVLQTLSKALEIASFREIGNAVNETIDWDESALCGRICVRPHIDDTLDEQKHLLFGLESVLSNIARTIANSGVIPYEYAKQLNVVYFPQLGFLLSIPLQEEWNEHGIVELEGWTYQFSSEENVYFKNEQVRDLDLHIGDIQTAIYDREIEIIQALKEKMMEYEKAILAACDVCAELDCLLSFAEASGTYGYIRPELSEDNVMDIKQGRHPLQELVVDAFVPNDAYIVGGDFTASSTDIQTRDGDDHETDSNPSERENHSLVVCTGANACGKSVFLKQVALIQFMAQIGCFVPAERAVLGIVDKIFTRIQTRESVSKVQSAFMIDLNQVSLAVRNCTSRSLILLDEFGKGTLSTDGAGLFCGILKHFAERGTRCPKVLAATHFHDIFRDDILDLPISFLHMKILFTTSNGDLISATDSVTAGNDTTADDTDNEDGALIKPGERITYLYRVEKGLWLNSHAAMCAEMFGLPRRVVQRARYVSFLLSAHELGQLLDEDMTEEERIELSEAEEVCKRFLAWDLQSEAEAVEDVRERLGAVLGRTSADDDKERGDLRVG